MISCSLDGFVSAVRKSALRAGEGLAGTSEDDVSDRQKNFSEGEEIPPLSVLFAPLNMHVSRMCMEMPVWIDRRLLSGRICVRIGRKSFWSGCRDHKLSIQLDGDGLSHVTVSFDGKVFRNEGSTCHGS